MIPLPPCGRELTAVRQRFYKARRLLVFGIRLGRCRCTFTAHFNLNVADRGRENAPIAACRAPGCPGMLFQLRSLWRTQARCRLLPRGAIKERSTVLAHDFIVWLEAKADLILLTLHMIPIWIPKDPVCSRLQDKSTGWLVWNAVLNCSSHGAQPMSSPIPRVARWPRSWAIFPRMVNP